MKKDDETVILAPVPMPRSLKEKAFKLAKKKDISVNQLIRKLIRSAR